VFYNRLKSDDFATLGSSPTCYYGDFFKYDDGRYNTYNIEGLPPGPLCSPGIEAIKAALYPESHDYYYFVTDSTGKFYYHKTSAEQQKTINKLQQGGNWVYEYFD
ncbi:MAG: endolytic transglycosylase MltG, partial [Acutalibacteraceae bacterium]|nr:endolytic transglycosylase MltG [Acutalibacteraceae bacterium]